MPARPARTRLGWALAILNGLVALVSMLFFLAQLRVGVLTWLMINACAPAAFLFVVGFAARARTVMVASAALLFWYGVNGLIASGWTPVTAFAQAGHILMVLAGFYVVVEAVRARAGRTLVVGALLGLAILAPYTIAQRAWSAANEELLQRYFSGELFREAAR